MIEMGKKYRTRDGRAVRIYAVDGGNGQRVHGETMDLRGWTSRTWDCCGQYWPGMPGQNDLIEVLPEVTYRRSVCLSSDGVVFTADVGLESGTTLGAIDITHNGKEILKVEVVK